MNVELRFFAGMETLLPSGQRHAKVEFPEGYSVEQILSQYGVSSEDSCIILINGRHAPGHAKLKDGDVLSVFPPVAGG